jgi:hypothetical protein
MTSRINLWKAIGFFVLIGCGGVFGQAQQPSDPAVGGTGARVHLDDGESQWDDAPLRPRRVPPSSCCMGFRRIGMSFTTEIDRCCHADDEGHSARRNENPGGWRLLRLPTDSTRCSPLLTRFGQQQDSDSLLRCRRVPSGDSLPRRRWRRPFVIFVVVRTQSCG